MLKSKTLPHRTPPGTRLYAIGDIHGRMDLLERLLGMIAADARASTAPRRVLVFLGDYIDRGPGSRQVIETLMAGPPDHTDGAGFDWAGFEWVCLKGNHEQAMLTFLDDPSAGQSWLPYGGSDCVASYAGQPLSPSASPEHLHKLLTRHLPEEHRRFLTGLPTSHREGDFFFAHAGIRPGVALDRQTSDDLLWIREPFLSSTQDHGVLVVHGHTRGPEPDWRANRLNLDSTAFRSGRLTALAAEGTEAKLLQT